MKKNNIILILIVIIIIAILSICLILYKIKLNPTEKEKKEQVNNEIIEDDLDIKQQYEANEFSLVTLTVEDLLRTYLNDYKYNMLNDPEKAFNSLNQEYREKRFGDLETYKKYISDNIQKIQQIKLNEYSINSYENYEEYICTDQYGNYYIFEVTAVMDYTLRLDMYTVDSKSFIDAYSQANIQEKVMLNIQKIINAINYKGYDFVYTKLDDTFKQNNYKTVEEFTNFAKTAFFEKNKVTYNEFSYEGEIYIYQVTIHNIENENNQKSLTIIMKLGEEMDFTMSFSFE